jgi:hypothetical protein
MKNLLKTLSAALVAFGATTGSALASGGTFNVPEPGSLALVGVAVAAAVYALRRKK